MATLRWRRLASGSVSTKSAASTPTTAKKSNIFSPGDSRPGSGPSPSTRFLPSVEDPGICLGSLPRLEENAAECEGGHPDGPEPSRLRRRPQRGVVRAPLLLPDRASGAAAAGRSTAAGGEPPERA